MQAAVSREVPKNASAAASALRVTLAGIFVVTPLPAFFAAELMTSSPGGKTVANETPEAQSEVEKADGCGHHRLFITERFCLPSNFLQTD